MDLLHTCLNVSDADELAAWYVDELGFERSWEFSTDDGRTRNVYVAADNGAELQLSDTQGEDEFTPGTAYDHIAVTVEDVDAAFEEINHHGTVTPPTDVDAAGVRGAFVEDPDGHVVELIGPQRD